VQHKREAERDERGGDRDHADDYETVRHASPRLDGGR
jgi:hypothetical protein